MAAIRPTYVLQWDIPSEGVTYVGPFEHPHRVQEYIDSLPPNEANAFTVLTVYPALKQDRIARIRFHSQV